MFIDILFQIVLQSFFSLALLLLLPIFMCLLFDAMSPSSEGVLGYRSAGGWASSALPLPGIRMIMDTFWGLCPDLVLLYHVGSIISYLHSSDSLSHWETIPVLVNMQYSPLELPCTGWCSMSVSTLGSQPADPQDWTLHGSTSCLHFAFLSFCFLYPRVSFFFWGGRFLLLSRGTHYNF